MHKLKIVHIFRTIGIYHRVPVRLDSLVFRGRFELFESHLYSAVAAAVTARAAHGNVNFLSTCKGHPPLPLRRPTRRRQHGGWPRNVISVGLVTSARRRVAKTKLLRRRRRAVRTNTRWKRSVGERPKTDGVGRTVATSYDHNRRHFRVDRRRKKIYSYLDTRSFYGTDSVSSEIGGDAQRLGCSRNKNKRPES